MTSVLGPQIYYWFIPFYTPKSSHIVFPKLPKVKDTKELYKDENGKVVRRPKI